MATDTDADPAPENSIIALDGEASSLTGWDVAHFWGRVTVGYEFECWEWTGRKNDKGYGRFRGVSAHRIAHELVNGPIPVGLLIRHKCDNPPCCNPKHLETGTHKDNAQDSISRGRWMWGEKSGKSKLTAEQVDYIVKNPDKMTGTAMAVKFGVSESTISLIRNKRRWQSTILTKQETGK